MRSIDQLRRDAKAQADAYAARDRGLKTANTTSPGGGGGGTGSVNVIVTGFGNETDESDQPMTMYKVKLVDMTTHLPVGEEFKVRVFSLPAVDGKVGRQDVRECVPNWVVGEPMLVSRQTVFDGNAVIDGDWCTAAVMKGCPPVPPA